MWTALQRKDDRLYLSDGSDSKWVSKEDAYEVMGYASWEHYFMSLDMRLPEIWCPNLL